MPIVSLREVAERLGKNRPLGRRRVVQICNEMDVQIVPHHDPNDLRVWVGIREKDLLRIEAKRAKKARR